MGYKPQFRKGRCYLRMDGKPVRIIQERDERGPHYRIVQGDDGEARWGKCWDFEKKKFVDKFFPASEFGYRYDRPSDPGRCTGSERGEPRNLVVGSDKTLIAAMYRVECEAKDFFKAVKHAAKTKWINIKLTVWMIRHGYY